MANKPSEKTDPERVYPALLDEKDPKARPVGCTRAELRAHARERKRPVYIVDKKGQKVAHMHPDGTLQWH